MKQAHIVVGLSHGDEGKGLAVDNLCNSDSIVVRFSGGFQCGHTVMRDKIKHVFSNFGSGTLKGCPTYFTEDTAINIETMLNELMVLNEKGITPKLFVNPLTPVATPYDRLANHALELKNQHGSCGLGYGATMKRHHQTPYKLYAHDLFAPLPYLRKRIEAIRDYYIENNVILSKFTKIDHVGLVDRFIDLLKNPLPFQLATDEQIISRYDNFVFEGSQGILLDMDHGIFPNVTYANTTSKNAWKMLTKFEEVDTNIFYITRCYQTRHGNGYMSNESIPVDLINTDEEINVYNKWQGHFKTGEIDYDQLKHARSIDNIYSGKANRNYLVVTCLDQRPDFKFDFDQFSNYDGFYVNNSPLSGNMRKL